MGCINTHVLAGISYNCSDIPVGGLKTIYLTHLADCTFTIGADGESLTAVVIAANKTAELEFNNKDTFTSFTDVKSVSADGIVTTVPTIVIEFPKMTATKRDELNALATAGAELVAWVETASGTKHCVGLEFGLYPSEINGQSGTGRTTKNVYQFTLMGEETFLAPDASAVWEDVVTSLV